MLGGHRLEGRCEKVSPDGYLGMVKLICWVIILFPIKSVVEILPLLSMRNTALNINLLSLLDILAPNNVEIFNWI